MASLGTVACTVLLDDQIGHILQGMESQCAVLLCAAAFIFAIGLVDDLWSLPARTKLLAEIVASVVLCHTGIEITVLEIANGIVLDLGWLGRPLTVFWIVGITNAVNLTDGLDGLAAGVSAIACAVIAVFAACIQNPVMVVLMLAVLGGVTGFLFYNFNPAKVFMGDCGSLFIGFTIACSSVMCTSKSSALVGLTLPMLALGIPVFDMLFTILRRFLERRSLFAPDRSHFHHRLLDLGFKQRHAVMLIYAVTAVSSGFGLFMIVRQDAGALVLFACLLLLLVLLFRVAGAVRVRETILALKRKHASTSSLRHERRTFEDLELCFRRASDDRQWWATVCNAARRLDLASVLATIRDATGNMDIRVWRLREAMPTDDRAVGMSFTVGKAGAQGPVEFEIVVHANGSLESAGHRAVLFSRLVDEHVMTPTCPSERPREANVPAAQTAPSGASGRIAVRRQHVSTR